MVSVERCRFPEIGNRDFEGRLALEFVIFRDEQVADMCCCAAGRFGIVLRRDL